MMAVTFQAIEPIDALLSALGPTAIGCSGKFLSSGLGSVTPRGSNPEFLGYSNEVSQRFCFHFLHDLGPMNLYRLFTRTQFRRNLLIQQSAGHQGEYFPFTWSQGIITTLQLANLRPLRQLMAMPFDPALNGFEQILFFDGLSQELQRSTLHCADRHGDISMPGDKDYGQIDLGRGELFLKIQAAQIWQTNIQHQAAGDVRSRGTQEVPPGCKSQGFNSDRPNEPFQCSANGGIVVNHENHFLRSGHVFVPSGSRGECKLKRRSAAGVGGSPQLSSVGFDDRTADRQSHPHPAGLGSKERIEEAPHLTHGNAYTTVAHSNLDFPRFDNPRLNCQHPGTIH